MLFDEIRPVKLFIDNKQLHGNKRQFLPVISSMKGSRTLPNQDSNLQDTQKTPMLQSQICEPCLKQIIDTRQQIIVCAFCSSEVINKKSFPTKQQTKEIKISDTKKTSKQHSSKTNYSPFPKKLQDQGRKSEILLIKSPPKVQKILTLNQIALQPEIKAYSLKQPQKIYAEFSKNTLTDFFDLSQCNLLNNKAIEYVHRARRTHKIKGLKLCTNQVTTTGFQKMIQFLQGICNINLANNQVSQAIFDVILKNRDKLESLRVLNLTHNPIHTDKKAANKIEEVKRILVSLRNQRHQDHTKLAIPHFRKQILILEPLPHCIFYGDWLEFIRLLLQKLYQIRSNCVPRDITAFPLTKGDVVINFLISIAWDTHSSSQF